MEKNKLIFTTGEFAKFHDVNKRTLHYYDDIGLFSPLYKGENGYRYYTPYQSAAFESICSLRELDMSIEEIKAYLNKPNTQDFMNLANIKIEEIDKTIKRLSTLKKILEKKNELISLCEKVHHGMIDIYFCEEIYLYKSDTTFNGESFETAKGSMDKILEHLKVAWSMSSFKLGCGSFISLDKILAGEFSNYDGLFTEIEPNKKYQFIKPKGYYLRGFCVGAWSNIPNIYESMVAYANENALELEGFAYERGINEFVISDANEYIAEISILCHKKTIPTN